MSIFTLIFLKTHWYKLILILLILLILMQYFADFMPTISPSVSSEWLYNISDPPFDIISAFNDTDYNLKLCPIVPPKLVGRLKVLNNVLSWNELENKMVSLEPGGCFKPKICTARQKVAIIIPYRNREAHLKILLNNLHPFLQRQQIDYCIYLIEQVGSSKFNRAKLFNIGFVESLKQRDFHCFIFHDVDLIPEDDRNLYKCGHTPRHMSVSVNNMNYKLPYKDLFGGVCSLTYSQMNQLNGFSNEYWGWGGEDDDMSYRIKKAGLIIGRYDGQIARYTMLEHAKEVPNPDRYKKLYGGKYRFKVDGLNNLRYNKTDLVFKKLYTWILVDPLPPKMD